MTNKEAVVAELSVFSVDDNTIEKALVDNEVTGGETYSKNNKEKVSLVVFDVLTTLLALSSVGEGGFDVKYDKQGIIDKMIGIAKSSGSAELAAKLDLLTASKPTVTSKSVW